MRQDQIDKACEWYWKHQDHYKRIMCDAGLFEIMQPPKENLSQPELWKGGHWLWFEETYFNPNKHTE